MIVDRGATFSDCGRYRYRLWRTWDRGRAPAAFVMLNPSTADVDRNDPTVERCQRRAFDSGFGGVVVANIFPLRSTDPAALLAGEGIALGEGGKADEAIIDAVNGAGMVVAAWGRHGARYGRGRHVENLLRAVVRPERLLIFGLNADGSPKHPLYQRSDAALIVWRQWRTEAK